MKKFFKNLGKSLSDAGYWTVMHDGVEHAGYLAFLGLLSFFPFLVFFVAIAGAIGEAQIGNEFYANVIQLLPDYLLESLMPRIDEIISGPPQGLMTLAIIGVIWTASSAVEGTRTILNRAYRVKTPPSYILRRLLSIGQFLIVTVCIIMAMVVLVFGPVVWKEVKEILEIDGTTIETYWAYAHYWISGFVLFFTIALTYYTLPNINQRWVMVLPGASIVLAGWMAAAYLFSQYLQNFQQVNLVYGSLGGIIVALLFLYITGIIFIFGAEFNYFFERSLGHDFAEKEKSPRKEV